MKLIPELKLKIRYTEKDLVDAIIKKTSIKKEDLKSFVIVREGVDARHKPDIYYVVNVAIDVEDKALNRLKKYNTVEVDFSGLTYKQENIEAKRPIVVGFGPSGMFCGLTLALKGLKPIIIEQGKKVDERLKDVEELKNNRKLNPYSNVQFGEGGAGTFSDGKLNTTLNNAYCKKVINEFILNGAPKEIFYKSKPHIGSDNLSEIVTNIRKKIESLGGKVLFNSKFIDFKSEDKKIKSIKIENTQTNEISEIETDALILAIGHSAINTFELLNSKNFVLQQKPFAMGVRIEQKQADVNIFQYGVDNKDLPNADYKFVEHLENGRSVFTFCMCPGGEVVLSSSEPETVVTNGMSNFARNKENANSALLVNVTPEDYESDNPLAGIYFQKKYEKLAFILGGGNYSAPCQRVDDFLGKRTETETIKTSFRPELKFTEIEKCLPTFVTESLRLAIPKLNNRINGFAKDNNLLIAIESRSSSPVRILRDESGQSVMYNGIFPVGEGAGYAGGIMSSAQDGIKCGEKVFEYLKSIKQ